MELVLGNGETRRWKSVGFVVAMMVLGTVVMAAAPAFAVTLAVEPAPKYAGHITVNMATGTAKVDVPSAAGDVYVNTATAIGAYSSTDLLAVFGDRVTTTGTGWLDQIDFTMYNSGSSAGPILTASVSVTLYDGSLFPPLPSPLGSLSTSVDFGPGGMGAGYYTWVTLTGLSGGGINVTGTDVLVTQTVTSFTGTATRLGIVMFNPPSVGTSLLPVANSCYISTTTIAAGFYTFAAPAGDLGYRLNVSATPVELTRFAVE